MDDGRATAPDGRGARFSCLRIVQWSRFCPPTEGVGNPTTVAIIPHPNDNDGDALDVAIGAVGDSSGGIHVRSMTYMVDGRQYIVVAVATERQDPA